MIEYIIGSLLLLLGLALLYFLYKTKEEGISTLAYTKSKKAIEKANSQANDILTKASEKAKEILFETEYVKEDLVKHTEEDLSRIAQTSVQILEGESKEFEKQYKVLFDDIRNTYTKKAGSILENIEGVADTELDDFRELLRKETVAVQAYISRKTIEEFEGAKRDIATYKEEKLEEVSKNINALILRVAKDVLGEAIPLHEHEKLVTQALERAKKEGVFS